MLPYVSVTISHLWLQVALISTMFHGMAAGRSHPDKVAPRGASRKDCRGHQNCHSKGPCLIYTRTEGCMLGYLQIQLCPISVGDKVTLHKGNAGCLIQADLTVSTSPFSACFCVKQMFSRGLGCVLCQHTAWPSTAKLVIPLQWGHILFFIWWARWQLPGLQRPARTAGQGWKMAQVLGISSGLFPAVRLTRLPAWKGEGSLCWEVLQKRRHRKALWPGISGMLERAECFCLTCRRSVALAIVSCSWAENNSLF